MSRDANLNPNRRKLLRAAGAAVMAAPAFMRPLPQLPACSAAALAAASALAPIRAWAGPLTRLTLACNTIALCETPFVIAKDLGYFAQNGLDVDFIANTGGTDQLLEMLSTGKADAGVDMIHRWVKPLEAGFDVKIIGSTHGGCVRLIGVTGAGATTLESLKGKTIGVSDPNSPARHFFDILLFKHSIDPASVAWRQYPSTLLGEAANKGEVQAIADVDPNLYLLQQQKPGFYTDIASNLSDEYAHKVCCVIGAAGRLVRDNRPAAAALVRSVVQADHYAVENPAGAARIYTKYTPKFKVEDIQKLYARLTFDHHPTGVDLQQEIAYYAQDFKLIGVLKKSTDPQRFAQQVYANVLT